MLNNIINRNEELNKLRANIKGLGDKLDNECNSRSETKQFMMNPMSKDRANIFNTHQHRQKDFTFQPLQDRTNMHCKPLLTLNVLATVHVTMAKSKTRRKKGKRKSTLYRNNENQPANFTSDFSDAKSFTQTDEMPSKGNILVEEDSVDTYESVESLGKVSEEDM